MRPLARLRCYFKDPNGQTLDLCVANLLLKFQGDPTVNESGMGILLKYFCRKPATAAVTLSAAVSVFTGAVKIHISHTRHNFANPNGQHLDLWVRNLL